MTRSPTDAVREQAAQLCSAMASRAAMHEPGCGYSPHGFGDVCRQLGVKCHSDIGAAELARNALWSRLALHSFGEDATAIETAVEWAEAEAMLRNGEVR